MDKLLKPHEVAEMLDIDITTIYSWTHQKFIPYTKVGRLLRFRESDIKKWLESRTFKIHKYKGLES